MNLNQVITELVRVTTDVSLAPAECNQIKRGDEFWMGSAYLAGAGATACTVSLKPRPRCS